MSYQVLARRWRPKNFTSVVGQQHVVRVLCNALQQQRLHHAYLLTGTRGVGKTTLARVFAKALECETGITPTPCGSCSNCQEIDAGRFVDLIEVDAASRTKVEDTRELLDSVQYLPAQGRFKIYLIDEVHMLSGHSFNALLKTLEEPPAHVKFLLATTDPQKLPVTILSRCLQLNLTLLAPESIQQQLAKILAQENIPYEPPALQMIAASADGSMRDALSLLDQAISYCQNQLTSQEVQAMLGLIDTTKILTLLDALFAAKTEAVFATIHELFELGTDFLAAINEILNLLHQLAMAQLLPDRQTEQYPTTTQTILPWATKLSKELIQLYYQIALLAKRDLSLTPTPKLGFEMMVLRMLAFQPESVAPAELSLPRAAAIQEDPLPTSEPPITHRPLNTTAPSTTHPTPATFELTQLKVTGPTQALLQHCVIQTSNEQYIELQLDPGQAPLLNARHEERIRFALQEHYGRPMGLKITIGASKNMPTSANRQKEELLKREQQAQAELQADNSLQELIQKFDAKIIQNKPTA